MLVALLIALSASLARPGLKAADWPQFRGPNRDGKSTEQGLLATWPEGGPRLLWSVHGVGKGFTHVAVAGGLVYVTGLEGNEGILRAYSLGDYSGWSRS